MLIPKRKSSVLPMPSAGVGSLRSAGMPKVDWRGNFQQSLNRRDRVKADDLRWMSNLVPVRKAIDRITNGVLAMPWQVLPPKKLIKDEAAIAKARALTKALRQPNREDHETYSALVQAIIEELLVLGFAGIERQPGSEDTQPFWLWLVNGEKLTMNPDWKPAVSGVIPRYFDCSKSSAAKDAVPFLDSELFLIKLKSTAHSLVAPSPLEVAYQLLNAWVGVGNFQSETVKRGTRSYLLSIEGEEIDEEILESFRTYWRTNVEGRGEVGIIGGKVNKIDLGSKTDEELYPKYTEYLLRMIALAFGLAARDFNITEPDNKSTAEVASDASFSQAVLPMARCINENLGLKAIEHYAPDYCLDYADMEPRGEKAEGESAQGLYEKGLLTRNEARSRIGQESLPNGDLFSDGGGIKKDDAPTPSNVIAPANAPKSSVPSGNLTRKKEQKVAIRATIPSAIEAADFQQLTLL